MPHAIFFFSCACIMVVELVAGRLIASHLGSSLYTWTAVIGVILAGITVGNLVGGRLADRHRPDRIVGWLFLLASLASVAALGLNAAFRATRPFRGLPWPLQILLVVLAIFLLPAATLGTLSPSLAKIAVTRARRVGLTLGVFYACGTVGSIAGTFLTGFWLLFVLGNTRLVAATSAMLALLGVASFVVFRGRHEDEDRNVAPAAGDAAVSRSSEKFAASHDSWRYTPHAVVFLASVCLMAVELLASRIIAEQAGSSLYTWTSVIGVVLAGMSLGSFAGGALSDRYDAVRLLGWLFMAASASVVGVLVVTRVFANAQPFATWHWPALVFTTVFCIFFLPSVLMGTFGPIATKIAVQRAIQSTNAKGGPAATTDTVGGAVGAVSAWNAAGSIIGTVASGFWLISAVGTRSLTMLVAVVLALTGLAVMPRRRWHIAWTMVAVAAFVLTRTSVPALADWKYEDVFRNSDADVFSADSAYQSIRVYEDASDRDVEHTLRVVALDYLIHGYVDLDDPTFLNYGYERVYRDVMERYAGDRPVSAFFMGGGSYTFPRWLLARHPGSTAVVAEIDPMVVEANYRATGLPRKTPIKTIVGDARNAVEDLPPDSRFDFFLGDAFNDLAVPYHLTTLEFTRDVASHLKPNGAYLVNIIDDFDSGLLLGSFVGTLERVFKHVYVFCTDVSGVSKGRDTFVVAASNVPLDLTGWQPNHDTEFEGSVLTPANLTDLRKKCRGRILTDDDAPVENLIAPVVRQRTRKE